MNSTYSFVTHWMIPAPRAKVWEAIFDCKQWPHWWKGLERVEEIRTSAHPDGVGSIHRFTWRGLLPYQLSFEMEVRRVEAPHQLESQARGELEGMGLWTLTETAVGTEVRYDWNVSTTKPWMNRLTLLARPFFVWNHNVVMRWGGQGLAHLFEDKR